MSLLMPDKIKVKLCAIHLCFDNTLQKWVFKKTFLMNNIVCIEIIYVWPINNLF